MGRECFKISEVVNYTRPTGSNGVGRNTIPPPHPRPKKKNRKEETLLDNVQFQGLIQSVNS